MNAIMYQANYFNQHLEKNDQLLFSTLDKILFYI